MDRGDLSAELVRSVQGYVQQHIGLEFLDVADVERVVRLVAEVFVEDRSSLWWWESLRVQARTEVYGEQDGLDRVQELLAWRNGPLTLVITDDERPPWIGVKGGLQALLDLLREHAHFEYFVIDDSVRWVLFDTHHNSLVCAGDWPASQGPAV